MRRSGVGLLRSVDSIRVIDAMISGVYYVTSGYDNESAPHAAGLRLMDPTPRSSQPCYAVEESPNNLRSRSQLKEGIKEAQRPCDTDGERV